jgi:cell division protein FtsW
MARTPGKNGYLPLRENANGTSLILVAISLLAVGVVMVRSSLSSLREQTLPWYVQGANQHIFWAIMAGLVVSLLWRLDYRFFVGKRDRVFPIPAAIFLAVAVLCSLLVFAPVIGYTVGPYARWIRLGPLSVQPAELVKLALLVFLAAWLSNDRVKVRSIKTFLLAGFVIIASIAVIATQDFGTAAVIGVSAAVTMLLAGVPWYYMVSLLVPAAGAFYALVYCVRYRWERVMTMMDPWSSYQSKMNLLAINSGGWTGVGLGKGIIKMGYLPERSTDYIFGIICEELGFVGACLLLGLLIVMLFQVRNAAVKASDRFGQLLAGSMGFVIVMQAMLHIAVGLAIVPPKGMGLPFVSKGGTSMVIMAAAVAMIVSVTARSRQKNVISNQ